MEPEANTNRRINLHLPQSWNECSTEELEHIASAIIVTQAGVDRYHPFNWEKVKLMAMLNINGIEVVRTIEGDHDDNDDSFFLVQRQGDKEPWPISTGQLCSLCEMLNWINDDKHIRPIFTFPYPTLDVRGKKEEVRALSHLPSAIIRLQGPPPLLDGYTWHEYRLLTDWMQEYMRCANLVAQGKTEDVRSKSQTALDNARNEFLAILFKPKEGTSDILHLTSDIFTAFDAVKWQVILLWWSSLMKQLAEKFPHVFKSQPTKRQRSQSPWDFYNRVTATLADEYKTSEEDQRNETYSVTLQKLENIALKAAEMERLTHKK